MPDSRNDWGTQPFYLTVVLEFLLGIVLVQAATVAVVLLAPADLQGADLLRVTVPVRVIGFLAAFWFASIANHLRKDHLARVSEEFARKRENLRVNAERSKARTAVGQTSCNEAMCPIPPGREPWSLFPSPVLADWQKLGQIRVKEVGILFLVFVKPC